MTETLIQLQERCNAELGALFSKSLVNVPSLDLKTAINDVLLHPGKRIRPLLVYAVGQLFQTDPKKLILPASAVELVHTYSLIHDDLPAMDNANFRRGQPACHKMHGEGMAILTGDALLTLAIELLSNFPAPLNTAQRLQMIQAISHASGAFGMIGGQALDITTAQESISKELLEHVYALKTGALFAASVQLGYIASGNEDELSQQSLAAFSQYIGLAFQIQDDIIDHSHHHISPHINTKNKSHTYVELHGLLAAMKSVKTLYEEAVRTLHYFGERSKQLQELTQWLLERKQ